MIIREAWADEIGILNEMAKAMHAESDFAAIPFDETFCRFFLTEVVKREDHLALVAEENGAIKGALLGLLAPFFFSAQQRFSDIALYVIPEARGSSAALKLDRAAEQWAKDKGAVRGYRGVSTGSAKAREFYQRMGYTEVGGLYRKDY